MKFKNQKLIKIEENFSFLMKIFEIIGFQNLNPRDLSTDKVQKSRSSSDLAFLFILHLCRTTIYSFLASLLAFNFLSNQQSSYTNIVINFAQSIETLLIFSLLINVVVRGIFSTEKFKKIYIKLNKCLKIIQDEIHVEIRMKKLRKYVYLQLLVLLTFQIIIYLIQVQNFMHEIFIVLLGIIPLFLSLFIVINYLFFVQLFNFVFSIVVNTLKDQSKFEPDQIVTNFKIVRIHETEQIKLVKSCRKIYEILNDTKKLINEVFGLTIFFLISISVIGLTLSGYRIFIAYIEHKSFIIATGKFVLFILK